MKKKEIIILLMLGGVLIVYGQAGQTQKGGQIDYYKSKSSLQIPADRATALQGKKLFSAHCSECHEFCKQKTGPSLSSVTDRRPLSWLIAFITSSQTVIASGDEYAGFLYKNYQNTVMPDFKFLSEDDILTILSYVKSQSSASNHVSGINSHSPKNESNEPDSLEADMAPAPAIGNHEEQGDEYESRETAFKIGMLIVVIGTLVVSIFLIIGIWKRFSRNKEKSN